MATLTIFYYWIWNPPVTVKVSTPMEEKEGERKNLSKENLRQRQGGWVDFPYQRSIIYHSKIRLSTCRTEISKVSRYFSLTNQIEWNRIVIPLLGFGYYRVHIISCAHYIVIWSYQRRSPLLKASTAKRFSALPPSPFRGDFIFFAQLESSLSRLLWIMEWIFFKIAKGTKALWVKH